MTIPAPKKDRAGVHSIDHFALEVPDLEAARAFFTAFGLRVTGGTDGLELRTAAGDHRWGRIIPGRHKRLGYLAFNCHERDFETIQAQIRSSARRRPASTPRAAPRACGAAIPTATCCR